MKAIKEIREERDDVFSFWVEKAVQGVDGEMVTVEEMVDETTEETLLNNMEELRSKIEDINIKLELIKELQHA
jgi:phage/plasmid-associated DNA primase